MSHRLTHAVLAAAVCLLILAPAAVADSGFRTQGKSGQIYTWAAGHC